MSKLIITGGQKLKGTIDIEGSKNAVLPILSATVLNEGINIIKNCPKFKDVELALEILRRIGCKVKREKNIVIVDSTSITNTYIPEELVSKMRSSIIFMGSMLSKFKEVTISYPGGCQIGTRPIDIHINALRQMGVHIEENENGKILCKADNLKGIDINLSYPSVGATENIILASVFANGETNIKNAAREPEVIDLQNFLIKMGINIFGAGTENIRIVGSKNIIKNIEHTVIPDRIVIGTYLIAAGITNGELVLNNIISEHLTSIILNLRNIGLLIETSGNSIKVVGPDRPKNINSLSTLPYPGFSTDMQAQIISLLSIGKGTSEVIETIFENRFHHIEELIKMGANIKIEGKKAIIKGVPTLFGANINAKDLRGGAALILSALVAEGETSLEGLYYIDRGYENIEEKLKNVGALIKRI